MSRYEATETEGGLPLIVIWEQPYVHGGPAKDALGWFTPEEAAELLGMPAGEICHKLGEEGQFDTPEYSVEWT